MKHVQIINGNEIKLQVCSQEFQSKIYVLLLTFCYITIAQVVPPCYYD